jgi:hypothetical protein
MNHSTILSDMARFQQADLLSEGESHALLKRAGITPAARPKRLLAVAVFAAALMLMLVIIPVQAAPSEHNLGSWARGRIVL